MLDDWVDGTGRTPDDVLAKLIADGGPAPSGGMGGMGAWGHGPRRSRRRQRPPAVGGCRRRHLPLLPDQRTRPHRTRHVRGQAGPAHQDPAHQCGVRHDLHRGPRRPPPDGDPQRRLPGRAAGGRRPLPRHGGALRRPRHPRRRRVPPGGAAVRQDRGRPGPGPGPDGIWSGPRPRRVARRTGQADPAGHPPPPKAPRVGEAALTIA